MSPQLSRPHLARLVLMTLLVFTACVEPAPEPAEAPKSAPSTASDRPAEGSTRPSAEAETVVVFLGDSLTAGYGLAENEAYPALVEVALRQEGRAVRVVNAGVSGDTTAGGLSRVDWVLRQQPDILVVALGGNDGLRGLDLTSTETNLRTLIERGQAAGARVLLAGMLIPPNYGEDYIEAFAALYPRLAEETGVHRIPFLLEGVAGDPDLNQADGIHPTAEGQRRLAETVLEHLRPLVEESQAGTGR